MLVFLLVPSTYKLFSHTVFGNSNSLTLSKGMLGLRHLALSRFPSYLSKMSCWIRCVERFRYVLGNFHFVLTLNDITLPQVRQG